MTTTVAGAGGNRLAVNRSRGGDPVLFIHGSSGGLDSWELVAAELRDTFTTITYARSAYPPSRRGPGTITFATEVDDLLAVVEATCSQPPHLVGGSYGAMVALHAAVAAPGRWRSVTVFEPPLYAAGPALRPTLDRYRDAVQRRRYATAAWIFGTDVACIPREDLGPEPIDDAPRDPSDASVAAGCAADLEAMTADTTDVERWSAIAGPVLLMRGELTWPPMPATMAALRQSLPQSAEHVVFTGQSHFAPHTAPRPFARKLRAFFERQPAL